MVYLIPVTPDPCQHLFENQPHGFKSQLWLEVWASLVAQRLKHLPPVRETQVRSLGQEDPLEKEMVTPSSILAWRIPWTEKPGRLQSMGSQRVGHDWVTSLSLFLLCDLEQVFWPFVKTHKVVIRIKFSSECNRSFIIYQVLLVASFFPSPTPVILIFTFNIVLYVKLQL